MGRERKKLPGWTMAETLVGMAIVFTLTGTVGYLGTRQVERARQVAARSQVRVLEIALESYALDTGVYPTREQGLDALYQRPILAPVPRGWNGPYLREPLGSDPWGGEYRYEQPGPQGLPFRVSYRQPGDDRD
jgi:general secretion pathway protein G